MKILQTCEEYTGGKWFDAEKIRHMGFTETPPKAPGLRDFFIDIESSDIPFMREYKEALKKQANKLISYQAQKLRIQILEVFQCHSINNPEKS